MNDNIQIIQDFSKFLLFKGKSSATSKSYCTDALQFLFYLGHYNIKLNQINAQILHEFKCEILRTEKENSIRRKIIGIKQLSRFLMFNGTIVYSPFEDYPIPQRDDSLRLSEDLQKIHHLFSSLIKLPKNSFKSSRDFLLINFLGREGLKTNELIELAWNDLIPNKESFYIHIKGNKKRVLELTPQTAGALSVYKRFFCKWKTTVFDNPTQFSSVFVAFKGKYCTQTFEKITRHGIKFTLYEIGAEHGISHLNAEMLRHYAIFSMLSKGNDVEAVAKHLGLKQTCGILRHLNALSKGFFENES